MKRSKWFAIVTDIHLWVPLGVLLLGSVLLWTLR